MLDVKITTDKLVYAPGDKVKLDVQLTDKRTGLPAESKGAIVMLYATDEAVFGQVDKKEQPASLPALVLLENEV